MKLEIYNCVHSRWLSRATNPDPGPTILGSKITKVFNFTDYDVIYMLMDADGIVRRTIIYPFHIHVITKMSHTQYALLSTIEKPYIQVRVQRQQDTITLASNENPYTYAPGMLGWVEERLAAAAIRKSQLVFLD